MTAVNTTPVASNPLKPPARPTPSSPAPDRASGARALFSNATPLTPDTPGPAAPDGFRRLRLRRVKLEHLHPHPDHAPAITKAARLRMAEMLTCLRVAMPILVHPGEQGGYTVIDGHHRLEHFRARGLRDALVLVVELEPETARLLRASWDQPAGRRTAASEAALLRSIRRENGLNRLARLTGRSCGRLGRVARQPDVPARPRRPRDPERIPQAVHFFLTAAERAELADHLAAETDTGTPGQRLLAALRRTPVASG